MTEKLLFNFFDAKFSLKSLFFTQRRNKIDIAVLNEDEDGNGKVVYFDTIMSTKRFGNRGGCSFINWFRRNLNENLTYFFSLVLLWMVILRRN